MNNARLPKHPNVTIHLLCQTTSQNSPTRKGETENNAKFAFVANNNQSYSMVNGQAATSVRTKWIAVDANCETLLYRRFSLSVTLEFFHAQFHITFGCFMCHNIAKSTYFKSAATTTRSSSHILSNNQEY
jgi:hypothetical protein